jgi:hypothetical protein
VAEIKFELRTRKKQFAEFWTINYNIDSGHIKSIEPGQSHAADCLVVNYGKVKNLLAGKLNQNDFRVAFNDKLGALDLVDVKRPSEFKKKHTWRGWLSTSEYQGDPLSDIRVILFNDTGIIRIETTRTWSTALQERLTSEQSKETLQIFITDDEDPHQLFGQLDVSLTSIIEKGYWETRLWAFMDHDVVQRILYHGQRIRVNCPPVANGLFFTRIHQHFTFSGITDGQTVISHNGKGKHVSLFLKDGGVWAQSHYEPGSSIDQLVGNLPVAIIQTDDPESFVSWAELPALMLRQSFAFELLDKWPYHTTPHVLYKASNIDIGVLK